MTHEDHKQSDIEGCQECVDEYMTEFNDFRATDDAQLFCQITNLDHGSHPTIWMREFGADFMAEAKAQRPNNKRPRRVTATGKTIAETLENLASAVAQYLYPS